MTRSVDPRSIPDDAWQLAEVTDTYRRYICPIGDDGTYAMKTEYLASDTLVKLNQEEYNDSYGKRFGDGRIVARIPLNVFFASENQINEKQIEGDHDHLKWWLNSEKARPFRSFRGVI